MRNLGTAVTVIAVVGASALTAATQAVAGGSGGGTVDIYSSLPLTGSVNADTKPMVQGIQLALANAHGVAGKFKVKYTSLDDSTATSAATTCDLTQSAANARKASGDSKAVYYIGEFNSGCSKVTIPILNQAGIGQVSPANTYPGLTTNDPGTKAGEPGIYYPTGKRTYLRIVPRDTYQGADGDIAMKASGCSRIAVVNDKTAYGAGLATVVNADASKNGLTVIGGNQALDPTATDFSGFAASIKGQGVNCVYTGFNPTGEVKLIQDIEAAVPNTKIFGGDGVCLPSVTNPGQGGFPASDASLFFCTQPGQAVDTFPGWKTFHKLWKAKYGNVTPIPYAVYGYEAMKLGLDTIAGLGKKGSSKAAVVKALFNTKNRNSVLGKYSFDKNGDTSITGFGYYGVGSDGNPKFLKVVG